MRIFRSLLLGLLLCSTLAFSQVPSGILRHRIHYSGYGVPSSATGFTSLQSRDCYQNLTTGSWYIWSGTSWSLAPAGFMGGSGGGGGSSPAPTVTVGTVTTLSAGSSATVTDGDAGANVTLNFGIPQGTTGIAGTCPPCPGNVTVTTGSIVIIPSGGDDISYINTAMALSKTSGKGIEMYGNYLVSAGYTAPKDFLNLTIKGYRATIQSMNSNAFTFIGRTAPTNNDDALNNMITAMWDISGITFKGATTQKGIEPGPGYGHTFKNLRFEGLSEAIHLRFSLFTTVENCFATNCLSGFIADIGNWSGATNFNSQSNSSEFIHCRAYMPANGVKAFAAYGCSGIVFRGIIIEGFVCQVGIDWDALGASVVKDGTIENVHFECVNGASTAFIRLRMTGNDIFTIRKCYGQYPAKFLDASSTSGLSYIEVAHVPWWRGQGDTSGSNGQGIMFTTSNVTLHFEKNFAFNNITGSMWSASPPTLATDATEEAGSEGNKMAAYHTYTVNFINPKN